MVEPTFVVTKDYEELSQKATTMIVQTFQQYPKGLYCFAGGDTPVRTLQLLVEAHHNQQIDLTKAYFIELDEWVGLDQSDSGSCLSYLKRNLFDLVAIPKDHVHCFDSLAEDILHECENANAFIEEHSGLTLSLLGVGVNGHIGFNEPGVNFDNLAHVIDLDEITRSVGQKYFTSKKVLSQGITLGIKQLLASKVLLIEANGVKKQKAIAKVLDKQVDNTWPVTIVNTHPNCYIIVDEATMIQED
jgi:glucosamine-6-phosphate deaminase